MVWRMDIGECADAIASARPPYLFLAVLLFIPSIVISASRWRLLITTTGVRPRFHKILEYSLADKYANALVPTSAMGIALRSTLLEREYGVPAATGLATIILDYGTNMAGSFLLAMPCILILSDVQAFPSLPWVPLAAAAATFVISMFAIMRVARRKGWLCHRLSKSGIAGRTAIGRLEEMMDLMKGNRRVLVLSVALSIAKGVFDALRIFTLFHAFGLHAPVQYFVLFDSAWFFVAPFMVTPGGVGAVESGRIALYSRIPHITAGMVAPLVVVDRIITYWLMVVVGAVVFLRMGTKVPCAPYPFQGIPWKTVHGTDTPSQHQREKDMCQLFLHTVQSAAYLTRRNILVP